MPTRRQPTMEERLLEAERRLRETEKKLQAALAAKPVKAKKKIPRPKGQSGKGSGYNLCRAMGLQSNRPRINHRFEMQRIIRYITNRFLDTSKTISKQDKTRLQKTIKHVGVFCLYLLGGWPIYDLIKQYLANNHQRYKRAVEKERAAESEDLDDWTIPASEEEDAGDAEAEADASDLDSDQISVDEAEEDAPNVESAEKDNKNDDSGLDFNADLPELSDNDMDLNQATMEDDDLFEDRLPVKSQKEKENMPPPESDGSSKKAGPKEKATAASSSVSSQKRKEPDSRSDATPRPAKKALTNTSPRGRVLMQAKNEGWPRRIDFDDVASRVSMLLPDVEDLQTDSTYLEKSIVWTTFLELIGYKAFAFSRSAAPFGSAYLGCGYFGPKGHDVIERSIDTLLADKEFDYMLYETLAPLIDMPCNWDKYDDSSNVISVAKFQKFIVIPHVAATLISKDLKIGMDDALQVLKESREYGELINVIDTEENVDSVEAAAARKTAAPKTETDKPSEPPRHRKVSLQKNEGVRPKKEDVPDGKPNKKQNPMDAKEKKSLPKKPPTDEPPSHNYETRRKSKVSLCHLPSINIAELTLCTPTRVFSLFFPATADATPQTCYQFVDGYLAVQGFEYVPGYDYTAWITNDLAVRGYPLRTDRTGLLSSSALDVVRLAAIRCSPRGRPDLGNDARCNAAKQVAAQCRCSSAAPSSAAQTFADPAYRSENLSPHFPMHLGNLVGGAFDVDGVHLFPSSAPRDLRGMYI
ncbi:hypothetical protein FB451DRAFT_1561113 [Mycena latifolia]|nr:hypothetical protein FB451DRAFT_1561113 [Mycena latifolia]